MVDKKKKMRKALVVGINNYQGMLDLNYCINNARSFGEILSTNGDGSQNFALRLVENIKTKYELKQKIVELFSSDCETALFYFSGHAHSTAFGEFIVTPDALPLDEGILLDQILLVANNSKAKNKIIILDVFFSSGLASQKVFENKWPLIGEGVSVFMANAVLEKEPNDKGNSTFTNLLLNAMLGGAANMHGHITPISIYAFIDQALGPWDQRPVFKTNTTQFTSLRSVKPRIPVGVWEKIIEYFPQPDYEFHLDPSFEATNSPDVEHKLVMPYATQENVAKFKILQMLGAVGLVAPVNADYLYFASMESKSCKLTDLGQHYWRLIKEKRI